MLVFGVLLSACTTHDPGAQVLAPDVEVSRPVRNVIVMINDGAGWGTWDAAAYWQYGSRERTPYANFPVKYGMTTYPLNDEKEPSGDDESLVNYDKAKAWDTEPFDDPSMPFKGYEYLDDDPTDSAASGTALASGVKTYRNGLNVDNRGNPVRFVTLDAKAQGKATGVVTSVPFSHATPGAYGAQNVSRKNYQAIARQMLNEGTLDLIMGMGGPGYNVNGTPCGQLARNESEIGCDSPHEYLAKDDWQKLSVGKIVPKGFDRPWTLIRDKADFEAMAAGEQTYESPLIGLPNVANNGTLQQGREGRFTGKDAANPSGEAFIETVPTLATMTRGALRHLGAARDGFFLMVEGGATDWAAHTSDSCAEDNEWSKSYNPNCSGVQLGRLIEETQDFNHAVEAVVEWVEKNSSWDETLLIVTTDHDNSMPMGPDAQKVPFQPVVNNGKGRMPGLSLRPTGDHSNAMVPLWAKGAGSEAFAKRVRGQDKQFASHTGLNDGSYVDNTDVHAVVKAALQGRTVEPIRVGAR